MGTFRIYIRHLDINTIGIKMRAGITTFAALVFVFATMNIGYAKIAELYSDRYTETASVKVITDNSSVTEFNYELSDFTFQKIEGLSSQRIDIGGEVLTTIEGFPELPAVSRVVIVPPTSDIQLQINNVEYRYLDDFTPIIVSHSDDEEDNRNPSPEFSQMSGFWPPNPVVVGEPVILRGYRLVNVTLFPMQYNPQTGQMRVNDIIDFQLNYDGVGSNIVENPERARPSSSIRRVLENIAVNPPRDDPRSAPERGSYLVIYPNVQNIERSLEPLLTWRARQGWDVRTHSVQNNAGTNTVKNYIQQAYNEWDNPPEMVVIIGDADGSIAIQAYNQTDLDYVLLEGNDILADADFGRISVESIAQLNTVVGKLVNYEADPWMDDTDWYKQGAVIAGSSSSGFSTILLNRWVRREWLAMGFTSVDQWYYNAPFQNLSVPGYFEHEINRGVLYLNYRGWIGLEGTSTNNIMNYRAHRRYPVVIILTCA